MSPSDSSDARVLFVEDAFDQALLVKSFLQSEGGFDVVHTQDGDQALILLESEPWDLLVTDLNLPGTDGFDVIRAFRERFPETGILATTGYTEPAYQEEALRAGANNVLLKPLERDDFLRQVDLLVKKVPPGATGDDGSAILALGGLVGDVEMGCGGTLMKARVDGRAVLVVPLVAELDDDGAALKGARSAADILGAQVLLEEAAMSDTQERAALLRLALRETGARTLFLPAMDDTHPARREAFRIAKALASDVPRVLGYQTATTGLDFRPTVFEDVREAMVLKMEALAAYQAAGAGRLDLTPRMAQAYARYWGRFQEFGEVEAFEIIRDESS